MPDEPPAETETKPCATCAGKAKAKTKTETNGDDMPEKDAISRAEYNRIVKDYEQTLEALGEALGEIDDLKARVTESEGAEDLIAELQGKLRQATHSKAFDKIAAELNIPEDLRDDVFKVSGYKAEADEPDEKAMREHFSKYVESRPSLTAKKAKAEPSRYEKGEGSSRGSTDDGKSDKKQVTRAQLMDPDWTEANSKLLADASAYEIVDAVA